MTADAETILAIHQDRRPFAWLRPPPRLSALQLATADLEDCRRNQLEHARKAEYHSAMLKMLKERDARLQKDILRLSRKASAPSAAEGGAE